MIRPKGTILRKKRVRAKIGSLENRARLSVFRSNINIYGSLIEVGSGKTIISIGSKDLKKKLENKIEEAFETGVLLGEKAKEKKIKKVVFDRGSYKYHGRVKAFAEGARKAGLVF